MRNIRHLVAALSCLVCAAAAQLVFQDSEKATCWDLGYGFSLSKTQHRFDIALDGSSIWTTIASKPFISASAGNDTIKGSNGALNITNIDLDRTNGQSIGAIKKVQWENAADSSAAQITGQLLTDGTYSADYALTFWVPSNLTDRVAFNLQITGTKPDLKSLDKLFFRFGSSASEDFCGLGSQGSFASMKNQSVPVISREQGVGRGDEPLTRDLNADGSFAGGDRFTAYTAIPLYVSTDSNLFYLSEQSTGYSTFDFTQADEVVVRYDGLSVEGAFTRTESLLGAIEALTAYTGRQPSLPKWVDEGAILGIQGGQDKVNRIVEQGLQLDTPIAAVWLQDWVGTHSQEAPYVNLSRLWWNWENDDVLYPTWIDFVQNLRDQHGVRTLSYVNTFLTNVSSKDTGFRRNLYEEATEAKYFVQNTTTNSTAIISSGPGLQAGVVDLTNPQTRAWLTDVLSTQVWNANISGFMTDFGEYTPVTAETAFYDQVGSAFYYHNKYPTDWAEFNRGIVEKLGLENEAVLFHRSAGQGSQKYQNLFWVGDQNVDWALNDGLKSAITSQVHIGFSGFSQVHSDIGGYTTTLTYRGYNVTRSAELLGRWGEFAAVSSSVFRSHEGNVPSVNAQFYSNATTYKYWAYNARLFVSLAKYRRHILETESEPKGWPLLRSPVVYHPQDLRARQISYESFYLGSDLYVAPVLDPQTFELTVYLPAGESNRTYEHVWTGREYAGGQEVTVSAPYGKPAVFVVNGARTPELQPFLNFVERENGTTLSVD